MSETLHDGREVMKLRGIVATAIGAFPPNPPANPYRRVLGKTVSFGSSTLTSAEGRVDFTQDYIQRRLWLPGIELVFAQRKADGASPSAHFIVNRFRNEQGHGLVARAWYQPNYAGVQRTYSEGPWDSPYPPAAMRNVPSDEMDRLDQLVSGLRQRPNSQGVREDLAALATPLNEEEQAMLDDERQSIAAHNRSFQQELRAIDEASQPPFHYGDSDVRL